MQSNFLLDVCENSFERVRGIGNIQIRVIKVDEEVRKIPFYAVEGTPNSTVGVVPASPAFIDSSLLEKLSPLVVPEL